MKPFIGITMDLEKEPARDLNVLDSDYAKAVLQAGGIPLPIIGLEPSIPDLVKRLDGFVFTGGDDIHPRFYRQKPLTGARLRLAEDQRVKFEIRLFKALHKARKPVLAICYGAQLVNVALGGSLFQDIALESPKAIPHGASRNGEKVFHPVSIFEGTKLCHIVGPNSCCSAGKCSIKVRSSHHQSVKNPGRGLRLSAVSQDGMIEALEARGSQFLIALQWHPEKTLSDRATRKIFSSLISAAKLTA